MAVDPFEALISFQAALRKGQLDIQRGSLDQELFVHFDQPLGVTRLSYVRLDKLMVTAFANFSACDPVEGKPCFQAGVAVPPQLRRQGRAKDVLKAAIAELRTGLVRNGIPIFYIEAIVDADNTASQRVAHAVISSEPLEIIDQFSNRPALQFLLRIAA